MSDRRLDAVDQTARRWASEDRIVRHARSLCADHDLDPAFVQRLESASLHHADTGAFLSAAAELLGAIESSARDARMAQDGHGGPG